MCPPTGSPLKSKLMSMYLPKRLELWLRLVRALPKASSTHVDLSSTSLTLRGVDRWRGQDYNMKTLHSGLCPHPGSLPEASQSQEERESEGPVSPCAVPCRCLTLRCWERHLPGTHAGCPVKP